MVEIRIFVLGNVPLRAIALASRDAQHSRTEQISEQLCKIVGTQSRLAP